MVVSTASTETAVHQQPAVKSSKTAKKSSKKSSSTGSTKSRRSKQHKPEVYYDQPRNVVEEVTGTAAVLVDGDHLYDVVRPRDDNNTYQNMMTTDQRAVYQNLDDM